MLYFTLVLSLILVAVSHMAARKPPHGVRFGVFAVVSIVLIAVPMLLLQVFATATIFVCILLAISLKLWPWVRSRLPTFLPMSLGSLAIAYSIGFLVAFHEDRQFDDLRSRYPYESMEDRVPPPEDKAALSPSADAGLQRLEAGIVEHKNGLRTEMLRRLHGQTVTRFANSQGFGVARIMRPSEYWLRPRDRGEPREQSPWAPTATEAVTVSAADEHDLVDLHDTRIIDFVNPAGFGYFKDRRRVAGFVPHGFGEELEINTKWEAERIELIGLLLHPEPVAYLSNRRPVMQELRDGPTRPPDAFETKALASIRKGDDLVPAIAGEGLRMVGAIRSARQCVDCHGGQRGDLLGAFSYTLRRAEPKP